MLYHTCYSIFCYIYRLYGRSTPTVLYYSRLCYVIYQHFCVHPSNCPVYFSHAAAAAAALTVDFRDFIVCLVPRPWHIEIRHRVKQTSTINSFGFETLKLKIRRFKLWKPTALYYIIAYCVMLYHIRLLYYSIVYCISLNCIAISCIGFSCIAIILKCIAISLKCIAIINIVLV